MDLCGIMLLQKEEHLMLGRREGRSALIQVQGFCLEEVVEIQEL
jgi:hypothetical protein